MFSSLPRGASLLPLPALSPTMTTGTVATWNVVEGSSFDAGAVLCEIETDKATVDYESVDDGFMGKILMPAGSKDLKVGTPIAVIAESKSIADELLKMDLSFLHNPPVEVVPVVEHRAIEPLVESGNRSIIHGPAAARICETYGVDIKSLKPSVTLPSGNRIVTKSDALVATKGKSSKIVPVSAPSIVTKTQAAIPVVPGVDYEDIELSTMRKVIAKNLTEAKQSRPHFYATIECELDQVLEMRKTLKSQIGSAPSINDIVVKAAALALRDVPRVNCRLEQGKVVQNVSVDVSVAVATPSGLITPIIQNADRKGYLEISSTMKELAGRAKINKLKLDEFIGGSFTVSNLGMFDVSEFTAIINPPQSAILAIGSGMKTFKVDENGSLKVVQLMTVQLSADRRVIDDVTCGQFLQCFQKYMSHPSLMTI